MSECQCPTQFPMIRVSEGKYRIGDTKVLIFVRVSSFFRSLFSVVLFAFPHILTPFARVSFRRLLYIYT